MNQNINYTLEKYKSDMFTRCETLRLHYEVPFLYTPQNSVYYRINILSRIYDPTHSDKQTYSIVNINDLKQEHWEYLFGEFVKEQQRIKKERELWDGTVFQKK